MGKVVRLAFLADPDRLPGQDFGLARAMDEALGSVAKTLRLVEAGEDSRTCLHALSADLLDLLSSVKREARVEAAVDDFYEAARRLLSRHGCDGPLDPERHRGLEAAYLRFRSEVVTARPKPGGLETF